MSAVSQAAKDKLRSNQKLYAESPRGKWTLQKFHAKKRGIAFLLTYEEWFNVWELSGKYHLRGKSPDSYCMGRVNDSGAYEVGNVEIVKVSNNLRTQLVSGQHKHVKMTKAKVGEMRNKYLHGATCKSLATIYGIDASQVSRLIDGTRGAYLT